MSLILLGPRYHKNGQIGGIVVSFELLLSELKKNGIQYDVIDTNKSNYFNPIIAMIIIYMKVLWLMPKANLFSLHGTANDYRYIAPFVIFFSRIFNKNVSLRKFAGSFIEEYEKSNSINKALINYALKNSSINFFQTKYLVKYFSKFNKNTIWYPTVRRKPKAYRNDSREYKKKFIFLGQIRDEKGVDEILKVSKFIDDSYTIDLYGSLYQEKYNDLLWNNYPNISYKGELNPNDVIDVLCQYDVLLFPTYWKGEGYPGVIVEALSVGLPIVATNLKGIKEMIDENSSVLINPKNTNELKDAIKSFDNVNYAEKSVAALKQFEAFNSEVQTKIFVEKIGL